MSWLFGTPTPDQAQAAVSALQEQLKKRSKRIEDLEQSLLEEKQLHEKLLTEEIDELESRKCRLQRELKDISMILKQKRRLLQQGVDESVEESDSDDELMVDARSEPEAPIAVSIRVHPELEKVRQVDTNAAFVIQRSQNSNTVVYAANMYNSYEIDSTKPLDVYWIMYENPNNPREELNVIERNSAYGVTISPDPRARAGHYQVLLASLKDRPLDLFNVQAGGAVVECTINQQENMRLQRVYVQCTTSWGIPTVQYIELFGFDPNTGEEVYEKKMK